MARECVVRVLAAAFYHNFEQSYKLVVKMLLHSYLGVVVNLKLLAYVLVDTTRHPLKRSFLYRIISSTQGHDCESFASGVVHSVQQQSSALS